MKSNTGFSKVPHDIFREANDLTGNEKIVYLAILDSELSFMSIQTISKRSGIPKRTTQRILASLIKKQWIRQINTSTQISIRVARDSELFRLSASELVKKCNLKTKRRALSWVEVSTPTVATMAMLGTSHRSQNSTPTVAKSASHRSHHGHRIRTQSNNPEKEKNEPSVETNGEFGDGYNLYRKVMAVAGIPNRQGVDQETGSEDDLL